MLKRLISVLLILTLVLACMPVATAAGSLRIGSRGTEVTELQNALKELGLYSQKVDGVYGRGTRTAVQAFQRANGLTADGIAGPKTLAKLYSSSEASASGSSTGSSSGGTSSQAPSRTLRRGDRGDDVKQVQEKLKEMGLYSMSADGKYGPGTAKAVQAFQQANGLKADGIAGPKTLEKMFTASTAAPETVSEASSATAEAAVFEEADTADPAAVLLERIAADSGAVCGTLVVTKDGETVANWSFGGVNDQTCFRIASVTKWVTAIGLMTLYDQGKLDLDRDISEYLPFKVRNPAYPDTPITARMLLSHTSSLSPEASTYKPDWESISKSYDPIFDETAKPGTKYAYADYNGALFGCLIEAITGESVQNYMDRTVFKPLGLTAAYSPKYLPAGTPTKDLLKTNGSVGLSVADDLSYNYNNTANPRMNNGYTVGGLYINTESMTRLARMMLSGGELNGVRILERSTVSLMEADQPGLAESKYGLSTVRHTQFARGTWYGHQGRYLGLTSNVYYQIETGITLALVMNGYNYTLEDNIVMPAVTLMKNMELLEKNLIYTN